MSWDDLSKNEMTWPSVADVTAYRRQVYAAVVEVIQTHPCLEAGGRSALQAGPAWAIFMAFEHERIHVETSSVLMRELPLRCVAMPAEWPRYHPSALIGVSGAGPDAATLPRNELVPQPAGSVTLGKPASFPTFGWDNEYGRRRFEVPAFSASRYLISNGEFLEFVRAGGYTAAAQRHWSEHGWRWRSFRNAKWPAFWVPDGPAGLHAYLLRLPFDVVPMPWALPAVVNAHEAAAFASWAAERDGLAPGAYRLPTEPEHARLRAPAADDADAVVAHSGASFAAARLANANLAWSSESAVDAHPPASSSANDAVCDTLGSLWEWCDDWFAALPGFRVHPFYDDFSTPCFDGEHACIAGSSFASTGDLASRFARFHFRPHFHQHAGFRLVHAPAAGENIAAVQACADAPPPHAGGWVPPSADPSRRPAPGAAAADAAEAVARALLSSYAPVSDVFGDSAQQHAAPLAALGLGLASRCAAMLAAAAGAGSATQARRALDVGAGVGALSFALAEQYDSVLGVDHSAAMIAAAEALRATGSVPFTRRDGADNGAALVARAPVPSGRKGTVAFRQMDPCCIAPDLGQFDAVVVNNVLDALTAPRSCLGRMGGPRGVVAPGGLVLVTCGHNWSELRTPREAWLPAEGAAAAAAIGGALGADFTLVAEADLPALSREHGRRFELRMLHATLWRRTAAQ
jgi:5-histidylcysteine sulfoxide synthase